MKKFLGLFLVLALVLAPVFVGAQVSRGDFVQVELKSVSTPTAGDGTGSTISRMHNFKDAVIILDMVGVTAQNGALHQVIVQTSPNAGTTWFDLFSFANTAGSEGAVSQVIQWTSQTVTTAIRKLTVVNKNLATNTVNHGPAGSLWRVVWVTTNASTGSFRFG